MNPQQSFPFTDWLIVFAAMFVIGLVDNYFFGPHRGEWRLRENISYWIAQLFFAFAIIDLIITFLTIFDSSNIHTDNIPLYLQQYHILQTAPTIFLVIIIVYLFHSNRAGKISNISVRGGTGDPYAGWLTKGQNPRYYTIFRGWVIIAAVYAIAIVLMVFMK